MSGRTIARGAITEPKEHALLTLLTDGRLAKSFGRQRMVRIPFPHRRGHLRSTFRRWAWEVTKRIAASYRGAFRRVIALVDLGGWVR